MCKCVFFICGCRWWIRAQQWREGRRVDWERKIFGRIKKTIHTHTQNIILWYDAFDALHMADETAYTLSPFDWNWKRWKRTCNNKIQNKMGMKPKIKCQNDGERGWRGKIKNYIGKETPWLLVVCVLVIVWIEEYDCDCECECEYCNFVTCCVTRSGCKFMYNRTHQRQRDHDNDDDDDGDDNNNSTTSRSGDADGDWAETHRQKHIFFHSFQQRYVNKSILYI